MSDEQCNHVNLKLLGGAIHPGGKDYYCLACGEQFHAELATISIRFGKPPHPQGKAQEEGK